MLVKLSKLKLNQRVQLNWLDSNYQPGWHYSKTPQAQCPEIQSVGWIRAISVNFIVLVSTQGGALDGMLNPLTIPRGAIVSIKRV